MTAGFLIFRYPLLRVIQTPEDTFTGTMSYITVILDILFMGHYISAYRALLLPLLQRRQSALFFAFSIS